MTPPGTLTKRGQEYFDDGDCSATEKGALSRISQQLSLVLLDERSVEFTTPEVFDSECASQELNVSRQADYVIVLESRLECFNCLLAIGLMHDQLGDHGVVIGRDFIALFHASVHAYLAWDLNRLTQYVDLA